MRYPKITLVSKKNMPKKTWADYDPLTCNIRILNNLPHKVFMEVLFHELSHWALDRKFKRRKGPRKEEKICEAMELIGSYFHRKGLPI